MSRTPADCEWCDFNHNGIINLVAFDHDTVLQVDSSGDIHIKITGK